MNPAPPPVVHEVLPREIMGIIFEEHAKLEWRAPAIDGRVCRIWRQIVLNTPRAWAYLEIGDYNPARIGDLRSWLHRSGTALLHIRVDKDSSDELTDGLTEGEELYNLLVDYHTRIASLSLPLLDLSIFEGRDFSCLQLLDIGPWYPLHDSSAMWWDSLPKLRSLCLTSDKTGFVVPWGGLAELEVLVLRYPHFGSVPHYFQSLTTLMLAKTCLKDLISGPVALPSLTYLSLYAVTGLKPYISAPRLITYREGWDTVHELLSAPVPSLVEYGVFVERSNGLHLARWQRWFPNILRLSIRAIPQVVTPFLDSVCRRPSPLPALQTISVRVLGWSFTEEDQEVMEALVRERSEACDMDIVSYFEEILPLDGGEFFEEVTYYLLGGCDYLTLILGPGRVFLNLVEHQAWFVHPNSILFHPKH